MPKELPNGPAEWQPIWCRHLASTTSVNALMAMTRPGLAAMAEFNGKLFESAAQFSTEWRPAAQTLT